MSELTKEFFEQSLEKLENNLKIHSEAQTEQLAQMVSGGFSDVMERFVKVDNRLDSVDERLDSLEQGQEDMSLRLANMAPKFEVQELQRQIEKVQKSPGI